MKRLPIFLIIPILAMATVSGFSQTTVTGHVFAEVVESVSASSCSHSTITIQKNQTEEIDFGQIEIKSGASASCSLILGDVNLTGSNNQKIAMQTSAYSIQSMQGNAINGTRSISLQCHPDESETDMTASQYSGDVSIVLAYN